MFAGPGGHAAFIGYANEVCSVVRRGAPSLPGAAAGPVALSRYAAAAASDAQKTAVSLARLPTPAAETAAVRALSARYAALERLYDAGIAPTPAAADLRFHTAEQQVRTLAQADGLTRCAP